MGNGETVNLQDLIQKAYDAEAGNDKDESLAAMLSKNAMNQAKLHKVLKVKHLRTSAVPRASVFSSNQTLSREGCQS